MARHVSSLPRVLRGPRPSRHFSEAALGALVLTIALANPWNRLNVPTRQVTGDFIAEYV